MRKRRLLAISCAVIVGAALITTVGGAFAVKSMAAGTPWTGTWSVSPQSGGQSFGQQTLRQIVRTSIGGSSAQVQVSNVFGATPLAVADVQVALRSSGSTIVSGTGHAVTFGGQASITIPAGGLAVSDAVAMPVPALSDVAVSMYLPQSTGSSTYHQQGTVTNYIASGDVSGNGSLPGAQTTGSYFFLANLNVQNTAAQGAVVTLGASITDGYASTTDANERWPNDLAVRLANSGRAIGVLNQGISGNRLLADGAGQSALNRFNRDVLSQPGVKWVIFSDDPINDLGSTSPPPTSAQLDRGAAAAHLEGPPERDRVPVLDADPVPGRVLLDPAGRDGARGVQRLRARLGQRLRRRDRPGRGDEQPIRPDHVPARLRQRRPPAPERRRVPGDRERGEPEPVRRRR